MKKLRMLLILVMSFVCLSFGEDNCGESCLEEIKNRCEDAVNSPEPYNIDDVKRVYGTFMSKFIAGDIDPERGILELCELELFYNEYSTAPFAKHVIPTLRYDLVSVDNWAENKINKPTIELSDLEGISVSLQAEIERSFGYGAALASYMKDHHDQEALEMINSRLEEYLEVCKPANGKNDCGI